MSASFQCLHGPPRGSPTTPRRYRRRLAEVHGNGIVHRDLKLANLFATRATNGRACIKLIGFGVSCFDRPPSSEVPEALDEVVLRCLRVILTAARGRDRDAIDLDIRSRC